MNIHPIRTDQDHRAALSVLFAYFDNEPEPGTEDGDRFEILMTLLSRPPSNTRYADSH